MASLLVQQLSDLFDLLQFLIQVLQVIEISNGLMRRIFGVAEVLKILEGGEILILEVEFCDNDAGVLLG
jgi:hypothetical protein